LLQIVDALRAPRRFPRRLHGREQERDQDRNDGDHDQQLDQGKTPTPIHEEPPGMMPRDDDPNAKNGAARAILTRAPTSYNR
jgi:hypothetical protein